MADYDSPWKELLADKLMKVWRRGGQEQQVLIHTEIEGRLAA